METQPVEILLAPQPQHMESVTSPMQSAEEKRQVFQAKKRNGSPKENENIGENEQNMIEGKPDTPKEPKETVETKNVQKRRLRRKTTAEEFSQSDPEARQ